MTGVSHFFDSVGNMPDSQENMPVGHVENALAKDIQATFLIATALAVDSRFRGGE